MVVNFPDVIASTIPICASLAELEGVSLKKVVVVVTFVLKVAASSLESPNDSLLLPAIHAT